MKVDNRRSNILKKTRCVVIKIGSSILVQNNKLSSKALLGLGSGIAWLQKRKIHTVLVSSGAIASGMKHLGFQKRPHRIAEQQACAAIGQPILMQAYQNILSRQKLQAAQILLTRYELENRSMFLNAQLTLKQLLKHNIIPIINENDTVAVEEIRFGDNDNLAALVTHLVKANLLILLTDQKAFYTADPRKDSRATPIPLIEKVDKKILKQARDTEKSISVGGMKTKLEAAQKAAQFGVPTIIASGHDSEIIKKIFSGLPVGTLFLG